MTDSGFYTSKALRTADEARTHLSKPEPRKAQILALLREKGYDPLALPRTTKSGGPKHEIREALVLYPRKEDHSFFNSKGVMTLACFDLAWDLLRRERQIGES